MPVMPEQKRYPENVPGPFYVEDDLCIICRAPEAISPNLVGGMKSIVISRRNHELPRSLSKRFERLRPAAVAPTDMPATI
jgi:hypothetical protein